MEIVSDLFIVLILGKQNVWRWETQGDARRASAKALINETEDTSVELVENEGGDSVEVSDAGYSSQQTEFIFRFTVPAKFVEIRDASVEVNCL